jgi:hypothetical protein
MFVSNIQTKYFEYNPEKKEFLGSYRYLFTVGIPDRIHLISSKTNNVEIFEYNMCKFTKGGRYWEFDLTSSIYNPGLKDHKIIVIDDSSV